MAIVVAAAVLGDVVMFVAEGEGCKVEIKLNTTSVTI